MSYWNNTLNSRITRRRALGLIGGSAAAAAFLAACGGEDDDSGGSSSGDPGGEIKRGGHLRLGMASDITNIDPHTTSGSNRATTSLLLESNLGYDAKMNPIPRLATAWELSDGGATVTLKIREGVKFHNGADLTAETMKWNFERIRDPNLPYPQWRLMAEWFPNIEVPDRNTIVLKGSSPRASLNDFLYLVRITDRGFMEGPAPESRIVGTGAFRWVNWTQGVRFEVEKNPDYWREGVPYLDGYTYNLALNQESMEAQFDAGDLDFVLDVAARNIVRYQSKGSGKQGLLHEGGRFTLLGFNTKDAPFGDARVRQAFNWSYDRERFANLVMQKLVPPVSLPWPENSPAFDAKQNEHYNKFDLKKASQLLAAAGVTDLSTNIITTAGNADAHIANPIWQSDLASIGVKLNIELMDSAALTRKLRGHEFHSLFIASNTNSSLGSPTTFWAFNGQNWGGDPKTNNNGYVNPELDAFVDRAGRELDPDKLRAHYREWNALILEESVQIVPARSPIRAGAAQNLHGITGDPEGIYRFDTAWLA